MKIEVLGTGCKKCNMLEAAAKAAADQLGIAYELTHVKDLARIAAHGVLMTPALVINGKVKVSGKVPSEAEIAAMLTAELSK